MDTGFILRWGSVVAGREELALALFDDTVSYFGRLMEEGKVTSFEPYLYKTSDFEAEQGFFLVKGPVTEIFAMLESDEYKAFVAKGTLLLHHLSINLLAVGDDVIGQIDRFKKARSELHV